MGSRDEVRWVQCSGHLQTDCRTGRAKQCLAKGLAMCVRWPCWVQAFIDYSSWKQHYYSLSLKCRRSGRNNENYCCRPRVNSQNPLITTNMQFGTGYSRTRALQPSSLLHGSVRVNTSIEPIYSSTQWDWVRTQFLYPTELHIMWT